MEVLLQAACASALLFIAPALAVRPKLIDSPVSAVSIPVCSVFVLLVTLIPALHFNFVTHELARLALYVLAAIGITRVLIWVRTSEKLRDGWSTETALAVLLALGLSVFIAGKLSLWGFDKNDEIYSWNKWAIDIFFGNEIDFKFTKWAYPLLFPRVLNLGYILNGSIEAQTAVKTALAIFPLCALTAIAIASPSLTKVRALLLFILLALLVFGARAESSFQVGMPDTMAATAVLISALVLFERDRLKISLMSRYALASICGVVAVLSKQPGLVWGLVSLPLLAAFPSLMGARRTRELTFLLIPAAVALAWWLTEGSGFHLNEGPVKRSMEDRDLIQQLANALNLLLTDFLEFTLVVVWMFFAVYKSGKGKALALLFVLPATVMWLFFANYDARAGLAALLVAGFLISLNDFGLSQYVSSSAPVAMLRHYGVAASLGLILLGGAVYQVASDLSKAKERNAGYEFGNTAINNYYRIFGSDALEVYRQIRINPKAVLWTPTHYVYGLFYGYSKVLFPSYENEWDEELLIRELRTAGATHATTSGSLAYGPGGEILEKVLASECSIAFTKLNESENKYNISVFSIDQSLLRTSVCDF